MHAHEPRLAYGTVIALEKCSQFRRGPVTVAERIRQGQADTEPKPGAVLSDGRVIKLTFRDFYWHTAKPLAQQREEQNVLHKG